MWSESSQHRSSVLDAPIKQTAPELKPSMEFAPRRDRIIEAVLDAAPVGTSVNSDRIKQEDSQKHIDLYLGELQSLVSGFAEHTTQRDCS